MHSLIILDAFSLGGERFQGLLLHGDSNDSESKSFQTNNFDDSSRFKGYMDEREEY
jgi:hypothetical protein